MPSQLVDDVRALLRERPLTMAERALLLATLLPPRRGAGEDVVDELEAAIAAARQTLSPQLAEQRVPALKRLLAASRAVLDHTPTYESVPAPAPIPAVPDYALPRPRADVDG